MARKNKNGYSFAVNPQLNIVVESPLPIPPDMRGRKKTANYDFSVIPVGGNARFNRSLSSVQGRLQEYRRAHPEQRFVARAVTKRLTRVWRLT